MTFASLAADVTAAVYDPKREAPPGAGDIEKLLNWLAWGVSLLCVAGVLIVAGAMAVAHRRGESSQHMTNLGWVFGACILAGGASALVGAFL